MVVATSLLSTKWEVVCAIAAPFPLAPPAHAAAIGANTIATAMSAESMVRYRCKVENFPQSVSD